MTGGGDGGSGVGAPLPTCTASEYVGRGEAAVGDVETSGVAGRGEGVGRGEGTGVGAAGVYRSGSSAHRVPASAMRSPRVWAGRRASRLT